MVLVHCLLQHRIAQNAIYWHLYIHTYIYIYIYIQSLLSSTIPFSKNIRGFWLKLNLNDACFRIFVSPCPTARRGLGNLCEQQYQGAEGSGKGHNSKPLGKCHEVLFVHEKSRGCIWIIWLYCLEPDMICLVLWMACSTFSGQAMCWVYPRPRGSQIILRSFLQRFPYYSSEFIVWKFTSKFKACLE